MLHVENITVRFDGLVAVEDITFSVKANDILSIIGPNGAGKTTIFNTITGFCPVSKGKVIFKGEVLNGLYPHEIARKGIARTFQKTNVFQEMTVLENIITASDRTFKSGFCGILMNSRLVRREEKIHRDRAKEILDLCGIGDRSDYPVKILSYGEQRLVGVAIALATKPDLLLLDEPAAGLNPVETQNLMVLIKKIRDMRNTVVLVEHNMRMVMNISDRIEVVNFGHQIATGTPGEIAQNEEVIRAYLGTGSFRDNRSH